MEGGLGQLEVLRMLRMIGHFSSFKEGTYEPDVSIGIERHQNARDLI